MVITTLPIEIRVTFEDFTIIYIYFVIYRIDIIKIYYIKKSRYRSTSL